MSTSSSSANVRATESQEGQRTDKTVWRVGDGALLRKSDSESHDSGYECRVTYVQPTLIRVEGVLGGHLWFQDLDTAKAEILLKKTASSQGGQHRFHGFRNQERVKVRLEDPSSNCKWYVANVVSSDAKTGNIRVAGDEPKFLLDIPAAEVKSFLRKVPDEEDYLTSAPLEKLLQILPDVMRASHCLEAKTTETRITHCVKSAKYMGVVSFGPIKRNSKPWLAALRVDGFIRYLGKFNSEAAAALRYDVEIRKYRIEGKCLNFRQPALPNADTEYESMFSKNAFINPLKSSQANRKAFTNYPQEDSTRSPDGPSDTVDGSKSKQTKSVAVDLTTPLTRVTKAQVSIAASKRKVAEIFATVPNMRGKRVKVVCSGQRGTVAFTINGMHGVRLDAGRNIFFRDKDICLI